MTVALIRHVLLLLIMSFPSSHVKQNLVYFFTLFFILCVNSWDLLPHLFKL